MSDTIDPNNSEDPRDSAQWKESSRDLALGLMALAQLSGALDATMGPITVPLQVFRVLNALSLQMHEDLGVLEEHPEFEVGLTASITFAGITWVYLPSAFDLAIWDAKDE